MPVDQEGRVSPDSLKSALRPDTVLVSIMAANNEIGTLQPVSELGCLCRAAGVAFHTDAVQWLGKEDFQEITQFNADLVSICAHKFHGPKGAGALYIRSPLQPRAVMLGGAHENERRAGTENLPSICGLVCAAEKFLAHPVFDRALLAPLSQRLESIWKSLPRCRLVSPLSGRLCNTVAAVVEGADGITVLANLDLEGICASSGAACAAGSLKPSHVIRALPLPHDFSKSLVRFSIGHLTTAADIEYVASILPKVIKRSTTPR